LFRSRISRPDPGEPFIRSRVLQPVEHTAIALNDRVYDQIRRQRAGQRNPVCSNANRPRIGLRLQRPAKVVRRPGHRQIAVAEARRQIGRIRGDRHHAQSAIDHQVVGPEQPRSRSGRTQQQASAASRPPPPRCLDSSSRYPHAARNNTNNSPDTPTTAPTSNAARAPTPPSPPWLAPSPPISGPSSGPSSGTQTGQTTQTGPSEPFGIVSHHVAATATLPLRGCE